MVGDSLDLRAQRSASEDPLALEEGGKLLLTVKAVDKCDLHGQPNLGQGDVYELDVVSPSDLLALLEARELGLRRDFERAIDEMKDARDSLATVQGQDPSLGSEPEDLEPRSAKRGPAGSGGR